jgi:ribosomal protein S27AE
MADAKKEAKPKKTVKPYSSGKQCLKCHSRMGDHKDRLACGKCGYTEFKQKK